ncbi:hypothetical protein BHM03_00044570 [Ensete ventricosum]|nr:hypothetical protein BHM03_00044570 [Ensete ventricosum]
MMPPFLPHRSATSQHSQIKRMSDANLASVRTTKRLGVSIDRTADDGRLTTRGRTDATGHVEHSHPDEAFVQDHHSRPEKEEPEA